MSFIKKLGGVFFETENEPKKKEPLSQQVEVINISPPMVVGNDSLQVEEFRQRFLKIMEEENKRNFPGNDYYEFQIMKNAMSSIPQENIRYQAAFAGWSATGNITKDKLVETANKYLSIVEREITEFEEAYQHQYNESVVNNEKLIASKLEEVQKLSERISALNSEIQVLKKDNIDNVAHLSSKHSAFISAGTQVKNEINAEINKINQYIV